MKQQFIRSDIPDSFYDRTSASVSKAYVRQVIKGQLEVEYHLKWRRNLDRDVSRTGQGGNKLRTYGTFKQEHGTEPYISSILPSRHRSSYAKIRCGVAPNRLETVRYERLPIEQRTCFHCNESVESEEHVLINCPLYEDLRYRLFEAFNREFPDFDNLTNDQKMSVILGCVNTELIRLGGKTCYEILMRRWTFLYQ